jgi:hypothetical protein
MHHHQITHSSHSINANLTNQPRVPPGQQKEGAPLRCVCKHHAHPRLAQNALQCSSDVKHVKNHLSAGVHDTEAVKEEKL